MALTSTLGSPGIEIREVDNSYRLDSSTATTVYIPGFTAQGPVDEVMSIGSMTDFETIYGTPTNAAERYFYYTVKAVLDNSGNGVTVLCSRLPYGSGNGDTVSNAYTLLAYPAVPVIKKKHAITSPHSFDSTGNTETYTFNAELKATRTKSNNVWGNWEVYENSTKSTTWTFDENTLTLTDSDGSIITLPSEGETTYNFDQYIPTLKNKFDNLFNVKSSEGNATTVGATVEDFYITFDEDYQVADNINITKFDALSGTSTIKVPSASALIDFSSTSHANAPVITIGSFTAKGTMAYEQMIDETDKTTVSASYVYFSYTIFNSENKKVGSIYVKAKYTGAVEGKLFITSSSVNIALQKKTAYELAASYQGQTVTEYESSNGGSIKDYSDDVTYIIGSPTTFHISLNEYYKIITGENLTWSRQPYTFDGESNTIGERYETDTKKSESQFGLFDAIGHSAFLVINTSRSIINNNFEGFYLGMTDNMFVNPSSDYTFDAISKVKITTKYFDSTSDTLGLMDATDDTGDFHSLNSNRLSFYLDSNYQGSISRVLTRNITSMDISSKEYDDTISMGLFKLSKSTTNNDILKLNYSLREKYNWSFGKTRLKSTASATRPVSYFAENVVENSSNLTVLINPFIAEKSFVDTDGVVHGKMRVFGNKLIKNLDNYEAKYLRRDYTNLYSNTTDKVAKQAVSAIIPAKLAKSSISSWEEMMSQAGVSTSILKSISSDESYKNFTQLDALMPFGTYSETSNTSKIIGEVPAKLQRSLELVENDEEYPDIDIVVESGLGTIYSYSCGKAVGYETATTANTLLIGEDDDGGITDEQAGELIFDENEVVNGIEDLRTGRTTLSDGASEFIENYRAVQTVFTNFANSMQNGGRGDCFYISDIPRGILIKGKNTKITDLYGSTIESNSYDFGDTVNHSFSTSVYYPIKHTFDTIVSSYMSTYAQWVKILDTFSSEKVWIPVSGYVAGNMAATDGTYGPWYAAAGLRRGVIKGVLDYAISPDRTQRTDLYKICINSVPKIPNYGVTIWGLRTMSKASSAFDQNTCRRTFLYMEKKVKQTLRYYIFEPNTSYTRLQIVNDIDPFLEKIKNAGGIYAYTLVCDTTNNTPDVINNGDLAVSIAAAPTRTAENIVVEFTANKYTENVTSTESIS